MRWYELLNESNTAPSLTKKKIAIYPGRFQPFHLGHLSVFNRAKEMFGLDDVYIATSDVSDFASGRGFEKALELITNYENKLLKWKQNAVKIERENAKKERENKNLPENKQKKLKPIPNKPKLPNLPELKSPFTFDEKKEIISSLFGIDEKQILKAVSPYNMIDHTKLKDKIDDHAIVYLISEKDNNRLGGNVKEYTLEDHRKNIPLEPASESYYAYYVPALKDEYGGMVSATHIRKILSNPDLDIDEMTNQFMKLFKLNGLSSKQKKAFNIIKNKIKKHASQIDKIHQKYEGLKDND